MSCFVISSNEAELSFKKEVPCQSTYTQDVSATKVINFSSTDGFNTTPTFTQSPTIRSDRQQAAPILTQVEVAGAFDSVIQINGFNDLYEAAFFNTFVAGSAETSLALTLGTSGKSITGTGFPAVAQGGVVVITSADVPAWNGVYKTANNVTSSATAIYLDPVSYVNTARSAATTSTVKVAKALENGVTYQPLTAVQGYKNKNLYKVARTLSVSEFGMNITTGEVPSQSFSFIGQGVAEYESDPRTATVAAPSTPELNPTDNIRKFAIKLADGSVKETAIVDALSFTLNNNVQSVFGLGSAFARDVGIGSVEVTGSVTFYFEDFDLPSQANNGTPVAIYMELVDANGQVLALDLPYVTLEGAPTGAPGLNELVQVEASFRATRSPALGYTIALYTL